MMKKIAAALVALISTIPVSGAEVKPFVSPVFGSHMVLQRDKPDPIWGWTAPGTVVTVATGEKTVTATANPDGLWKASLPAMPAGGPIVITVKADNRPDVTLDDVLVGDVWVCSGQSNMSLNLGAVNDSKKEIRDADFPNIRLFSVPFKPSLEPRETAAAKWMPCDPKSIAGFSATAYFFGRDLQKELNVPIGLIHTSVGGTPVESWTSEKMLRLTAPEFNTRLDEMAVLQSQQSPSLEDWYKANDPGTAGNWQAAAFDDSKWKSMDLPQYFQTGDPALAGKNGICWFRRKFDLPNGATGPGVLKLLVDDNDATFINGKLVGRTDGFSAAREYDVPAADLKPTGNVIAVRCHDTGGMGGIYGGPADLSLTFGKTAVPITGPWKYDFSMPLEKLPPLPPGRATLEADTNNPAVLFNGMVNPLVGMAFKGVIWYQGENNAHSPRDDRKLHNIDGPDEYRTLLPAMIDDWRNRWGQGEFPFLIVQLAGFEADPSQPGPGDDAWAELRAAQWFTYTSRRHIGIMTAIDIGEAKDIHPKNKQEVGRRLANVALHDVYEKDVAAYGPVFKSMAVDGGTARIEFDRLERGLKSRTPKLQGFAIAGVDGKFVWADAKLAGNSVEVSSPKVPHPTVVSYAWGAYVPNSLTNSADLPAFPFRTDRK